jgi:hypothetical protein
MPRADRQLSLRDSWAADSDFTLLSPAAFAAVLPRARSLRVRYLPGEILEPSFERMLHDRIAHSERFQQLRYVDAHGLRDRGIVAICQLLALAELEI